MTFLVIIIAAILPFLKKKATISEARKQDVLFQVSGLILLIIILVFSVGGLDYPVGLVQSPMNIFAIVMFIIGLIISISGHVAINKNYSWTLEIREEHTLVENGLYKYVRHPIYLGTFIRVIAIPIYTSSLPGFLFGLLAIPVLNYRIGIEERMLIEEFGEEYIRYRERTWKLFPYLF
jgi:protein-S-isoprenylcysteine O-methyltransferase Ste14